MGGMNHQCDKAAIDAGKIETSRVNKLSKMTKFMAEGYDHRHGFEPAKPDTSELLTPFFLDLEQNGLHVQALECITAYLGEPHTCFLRDYSALDCIAPEGVKVRKGIELKVRIIEELRTCENCPHYSNSDRAFLAEHPEPKRPLRKFDLHRSREDEGSA